jgi:hypothetical protein
MNPFIQQLLNVAKNTARNANRNLGVQTLRNMGPSMRRAAGLSSYSIGPITAATKQDPSLLRALPSFALAVPGMKTSLGLTAASSAVGTANRTGLTGAIEGGLNQIGPGLDRFFGAVTPQGIQKFGREQENNSLIQALDPTFGLLSGIFPGTNPPKGSAPSLRNYGPEYKENELAAGAAAERFRTGAGFPGQQVSAPMSSSGAAERNYEAEKRRAAQLAMQDQLSKKYQVADLTKAYNTASPEEKEKIGLQIWATTNPELAQKLRPGQTGYSEAVSAVQSRGPMGAITKAVGDMEYANRAFGAAPTTPVPAFGALQAPISGINLPPADQLGVKENLFASAPPGVPSTVFTDPLKSFSPEALSQTQLALLRQAFNKKLK